MKKILSLLFVAGTLAIVACGPSAEEKQKMEQAKQDSIAQVQAANKAAEEAASMQKEKAMKNKLFKILTGIALLISSQVGATGVSGRFFGQNAWMPDSIGSSVFRGSLNRNWGNISASGAGTVRYGGTAVDQNMPTTY